MIHKQTLKDTGKTVMPVFIIIMITASAALIGSFYLDLGATNPTVEIVENTDENTVMVELENAQDADSIWITTSNIPNSNVTGSINTNTSSDKKYLLNEDGDNTTISINTEGIDTQQSEVNVISEIDGEQTVIQTYEFE